MRILICSWGNICEPDLELSLIDMGHEVKVLKRKIENKDYDVEYLKFLSEELMLTLYDCVFSINYVPIISRVCNAHKIKYISWTVDSPLFQLNSDTVCNLCNYIFIFDYQLFDKFKHRSTHIYYMPLGANVNYFDRVIMAEEERVKYQAEVSFVGSLYEDKHQYDKVVLSDYLRGYLDGIIEAQSYIYGYNFLESMLSDKMVEEFCSAASWCGFGDDYKVLPKEVISTEFLGRKCAEIERFRCVSKLAEYFSLDLYTLSDTSSIPHVNNKGPADSRVEMPKIFKASKINLNMTIKTIETGIPQRIFDIMGCGGFVITNYQSEIMDYFVPGEDLVVYESLEDLISKVDYYLKHEEQRQKIAETGYRKVKSLYTVESRLKEIIEIVWQDRLHSYGVSHPKSKEKYIAIKELISKLEFDCILDVGVYLSRYSGIDSCESESLIEHQHIDGVDLIHYMKNEVGANLYQKLYETGKVTDQYSIVLLIEILKYFNKEEQIALLERFSQVSNLLLLDYDEGYLDIVKQNPYWKEEVIQINQCKLLLVTII